MEFQIPINIKMDKLCSVTKWNTTEGNKKEGKKLQLQHKHKFTQNDIKANKLYTKEYMLYHSTFLKSEKKAKHL